MKINAAFLTLLALTQQHNTSSHRFIVPQSGGPEADEYEVTITHVGSSAWKSSDAIDYPGPEFVTEPVLSLESVISAIKLPEEFIGSPDWQDDAQRELKRLTSILASINERLISLENQAAADERPAV